MKPHHLDSSIVIPFVSAILGTREEKRVVANQKALKWVSSCRAPIKISMATYAETLRHFGDIEEVEALLRETFSAPLPLTASVARRWSRMQNRSERTMGDNDAWVAALAVMERGVVVGHDRNAFHERPDVEYVDYLRN